MVLCVEDMFRGWVGRDGFKGFLTGKQKGGRASAKGRRALIHLDQGGK